MGYKNKDERLDQIGRDLSVHYVLENSLRESQAEFAQAHPVKSEAFDAYLQGYRFLQGNTDKDTSMAAKYFEQATQLDPGYVLAWVGLSRARNWQATTGLIPAEEGHRLARAAVERALVLNPNLAAAHAQMGRLKRQVDFDWVGANASLQRAVAPDPGDLDGVRQAAGSAAMLGRFEEALQLNLRAVDLDPLNADSWYLLVATEYFMGRLDQAAADSKKALALSPDLVEGPGWLSYIYILQRRPHDALPEIERESDNGFRLHLYALAYHALGREKESDAALRELIAKYHAIDAFQVAEVYAFRNQSDKAFEWLNRAYAQRDSGLIGTKVEPLLKSLHKDPRYAGLLKKLNLPT